jgi:hypothetical protein
LIVSRNAVKTPHYTDAILVVNYSSSSIFSNPGLGPESTEPGPRPGPSDVQMNWLSSFLHIKPASRTLCFHVGRGKVRGDLVRLLRDWQRFGVRDVTFDRTANTINARVDKINRKCSHPTQLLFSEWKLDGFCFQLELLEVKSVFRCNSALSSHAFLVFVVHIANNTASQTLTSNLFRSSLSSSSFWSMATEPTSAWPASLRSVVQHPASARSSTSSKMCAAQSLCWSRVRRSKQR